MVVPLVVVKLQSSSDAIHFQRAQFCLCLTRFSARVCYADISPVCFPDLKALLQPFKLIEIEIGINMISQFSIIVTSVLKVLWPSGLRRQVEVLVSSEARVRISRVSLFFFHVN